VRRGCRGRTAQSFRRVELLLIARERLSKSFLVLTARNGLRAEVYSASRSPAAGFKGYN